MAEARSLDPQLRVFVACPRSGSALLMRIFAESSECAVTSRLVFMGNAAAGGHVSSDQRMLQPLANHDDFTRARRSGKRFLICKEEPGNISQKDESHFEMFPSFWQYAMVRPVFLIRDPIRVFDSWKSVGWTDIQSMLDCYNKLFAMIDRSPCHIISCLLYERLIRDPKTETQRICTRWGIPFTESMLQFKLPFPSDPLFSTNLESPVSCAENRKGLLSMVEANSSVKVDVPYHSLLSNNEKTLLEEHVGRLYLRCWKEDVSRLRVILAEKTWFGFDLDDTLHEFRRASGNATSQVLGFISQNTGTDLAALTAEYSRIIKEKTANAFSDGKTSFDYRRERFTTLLLHFSLPLDEDFLPRLQQLYETTLTESLELKCGALSLLSTLKEMGKKIVVITEGPQDAQERTVQRLGIGGYIDFLATTNYFRVTKTDGLFANVLEHLGVSAGDMAYIGDNEQRDVKPAIAEGIFSIHLAEDKPIYLATEAPQINTLRKLQYLLSVENTV